MQMNCFVDLAALQVFSSAKDISESMGVLQAAGHHSLHIPITGKPRTDSGSGRWKTDGVLCISIGDGVTP